MNTIINKTINYFQTLQDSTYIVVVLIMLIADCFGKYPQYKDF